MEKHRRTRSIALLVILNPWGRELPGLRLGVRLGQGRAGAFHCPVTLQSQLLQISTVLGMAEETVVQRKKGEVKYFTSDRVVIQKKHRQNADWVTATFQVKPKDMKE